MIGNLCAFEGLFVAVCGAPLPEVDQTLSLYKDAHRIVFHYFSYQYGMLASFRNGNSRGCAYENVKLQSSFSQEALNAGLRPALVRQLEYIGDGGFRIQLRARKSR